jgi:hypothetical protein
VDLVKLTRVLTMPAVLLFCLVMAVPAFADETQVATQSDVATIQAQFSCTQVGKVCFTLTVTTQFVSAGRDVTLTLLGHKIGDPAGMLTTINSQTLHLDAGLDGATLPPICFDGVTTAPFDSFVLRIAVVGTAFTVNGKESVDLGAFTNNCPPPPTPTPTPTPRPRPSPSPSPSPTPTASLTASPTATPTASTTTGLAQTGGFNFVFLLIGLVVIVAGLAVYLVSASRTRGSTGQK